MRGRDCVSVSANLSTRILQLRLAQTANDIAAYRSTSAQTGAAVRPTRTRLSDFRDRDIRGVIAGILYGALYEWTIRSEPVLPRRSIRVTYLKLFVHGGWQGTPDGLLPDCHSAAMLRRSSVALIQRVRWPSWWANNCDRCGIGLEHDLGD